MSNMTKFTSAGKTNTIDILYIHILINMHVCELTYSLYMYIYA